MDKKSEIQATCQYKPNERYDHIVARHGSYHHRRNLPSKWRTLATIAWNCRLCYNRTLGEILEPSSSGLCWLPMNENMSRLRLSHDGAKRSELLRLDRLCISARKAKRLILRRSQTQEPRLLEVEPPKPKPQSMNWSYCRLRISFLDHEEGKSLRGFVFCFGRNEKQRAGFSICLIRNLKSFLYVYFFFNIKIE